MASKHFKDIRSQYMRDRLHDNFYGPREWYFLARKKARNVRQFQNTDSLAAVETVGRQSRGVENVTITSVNHGLGELEPPGYPFISQLQMSSDDEAPVDYHNENADATVQEQQAKWERYRESCANLYPTSSFAVEERVRESWNYYCDPQKAGEDGHLQIPKSYIYGGFKISFRDKYRTSRNILTEMPSGCSPALFESYQKLAQSNPWQTLDSSINAGFLNEQVLDKIENENDCRELLLPIMQHWRELCSGDFQHSHKLDTASSELSDALINKTCQLNSPDVALRMLQFKNVYKLQPSVKTFENLMASLALRHLQISQQPDAQIKPEQIAPPAKPSGKRKVARRDFPFRQGPRFYFYKPLPFVMNPEPSLFSEFALPKLPEDNDTKRLLPDDQRKKLHLMISEAEKNHIGSQYKESLSDESLTDMYRLYHYMTSDSPNYYGLKSTPAIMDFLILAGTLSKTEEGWRRNTLNHFDIINSQGAVANALSSTGVAGLMIGDEFMAAPDVKLFREWASFSSLADCAAMGGDSLNLGALGSLVASKSFLASAGPQITAMLENQVQIAVPSDIRQSQAQSDLRMAALKVSKDITKSALVNLSEKGHQSLVERLASRLA